MEIGLWDLKRIAQVTGHSADSLTMKVDQFRGINSCRHKKYVEGRDNYMAGLNEWADADAAIWNEYKDTSLLNLNFLAKIILKSKFVEYQAPESMGTNLRRLIKLTK
jgi:hypothetical protein